MDPMDPAIRRLLLGPEPTADQRSPLCRHTTLGPVCETCYLTAGQFQAWRQERLRLLPAGWSEGG